MSESCEHCKHWREDARYGGLLGDCLGIIVSDTAINQGTILRETRGKAFIKFSEVGDGRLVTSYAFGCRMFRYKEEE